MITCFIRYEIDPTRVDAFADYARVWGEAIPRCGADLLGYWGPHEGSATTAYGVYSLPSLAAYEAYRAPARRCGGPRELRLRASRAIHPRRGPAVPAPAGRAARALIAVIFEVWPAPERTPHYLDLAAALKPQLEDIDGFVSIERFESLAAPGKLLSLSFWRDEAAVAAWRNGSAHRSTQAAGRREVFTDYRLRVAAVIRDYGMTERAEAPADSRAAHGA